jgi:hypothetical protein
MIPFNLFIIRLPPNVKKMDIGTEETFYSFLYDAKFTPNSPHLKKFFRGLLTPYFMVV